jgi:hypothetical protein
MICIAWADGRLCLVNSAFAKQQLSVAIPSADSLGLRLPKMVRSGHHTPWLANKLL